MQAEACSAAANVTAQRSGWSARLDEHVMKVTTRQGLSGGDVSERAEAPASASFNHSAGLRCLGGSR